MAGKHWTLGEKRKLARYLQYDLSYSEIALLMKMNKNMIAGEVHRQRIKRLTPEEVADRLKRKGYEQAKHGRRMVANRISDERTYIEPWSEYSARMKKEREAKKNAGV